MTTGHKTAGSAAFFLYDLMQAFHPYMIENKPFRAIFEYNPELTDGFKLYFQEYETQDNKQEFDIETDHHPLQS